MADLPPYPDSNGNADANDDAGVRPDRETTANTPLWVKVFGIIALALVLLFVILTLAGGDHGPSRHTPSGGFGGHTPLSSVIERGVQQSWS